MNLYVWGIGRVAAKIKRALSSDIVAFIDNDITKQGNVFDGKNIISAEEAFSGRYPYPDWIFIGNYSYKGIIYDIRRVSKEKGASVPKVMALWDVNAEYDGETPNLLDVQQWRIIYLEEKLTRVERILSKRIENIGFENKGYMSDSGYWLPKIGNTLEAIKKITYEGCSLVRFGDGEFSIMAGQSRAPFQVYDRQLSERLREVIQTRVDNLLVAIANNYGDLFQYSDGVADGIRAYMTRDVREFHRRILSSDRVYYDAYMFKSYMPYKDKSAAKQRLCLIKKIWDGREVLIIEGKLTRTGCGNDLLQNAKSIQRILCPTSDAFKLYGRILDAAKQVKKDKLILVILGPAGKVLTYDLVKCGYQVIDIGQIDMDYDWQLADRGYKVANPYKYVSQLPPANVYDFFDEKYISEIIDQVE